MSTTYTSTPTKAQCKPFDRLIAALEAVGFVRNSGGEGFDLWLEARMPEVEQAKLPGYEGDKAHGEHALHFSFDARTGKVVSYAITRDVWECTDEQTVVDVKCKNEERP